jgi:hypothetical protein
MDKDKKPEKIGYLINLWIYGNEPKKELDNEPLTQIGKIKKLTNSFANTFKAKTPRS